MIFDVDGTLVDTNPAHVLAWARAFERLGYKVTQDRISAQVGKGGDRLVPAILGEAAARRDGAELSEAHTEAFLAIAASRQLCLFPGARELLQTARRCGFRTALATSSTGPQLDATFRSAGIDLRQEADLLVSADHAESKPAPDLVEQALARLELPAESCAMVGDTPYDAEACRRAGVRCIGVLSGGDSAARLRAAGAADLFRDAAEVAHWMARYLPPNPHPESPA